MKTTLILLVVLVVSSCRRESPRLEPDKTALQQRLQVPRAVPVLRIATWNLDWLNRRAGAGIVKRTEADYQRLRGYAERLDADIVAFQEVDGTEAAQRVFDGSRYLLHVTQRSGLQRTGFAWKRGLKVTRNPDYDALNLGRLRSGADITVDFNGHALRLLNVHLKSGCFEEALGSRIEACRKLKAQVPVLEAWIDARSREHVAAIVLGDFNRRFFDRLRDPFWVEIDDADPSGSELMSPSNGIRSQCWSSQYPALIDHIVFNGFAAPWYVPQTFAQLVYDVSDAGSKAKLSDHCPISVNVTPGQASSTIRRVALP